MFGDPLDEIAATWKAKLLETLEVTGCLELPMMLSGGVDSATLLAGCLELGHKPQCYSYHLEGRVSTDFKVSQLMCDAFGLKMSGIVIPRTRLQLEKDVREVIEMLGSSKKAQVQCCQPVMHMCRLMASHGHIGCIVGTGAVCLDDRKVNTIWGQKGEDAAREYRKDKLNDKNTDCGTGAMHRMARLFSVPMVEPYSEEPLGSHALALDYRELNQVGGKWKQKGIALRAFPGFWNRGWYRTNSSLQVNSGVREWHDVLL